MRRRVTITVFLVLTLGPLVLGLGYSLLYSLGMAGLMGRGFTLDHWVRLWEDGEALGSLWYTLLLTLSSLLLSVVPALLVARWLIFAERPQKVFAAYFLPLTVPPLIAGFAMYHLLSPAGLLSRLAYHAGAVEGLESFPRLTNDAWSIGIILTHVFLVFPFFTIVFTNIGKKEKLPELRNMARTLGAGESSFFLRVYLPMLLRRGASLLLLYGVFLFGTYEVPLLLGRQSPRAVTIMITEKISKFDLSNIPVGHAMTSLYLVLVILVVTLLLRFLRLNTADE